jgi:hypothetical protein
MNRQTELMCLSIITQRIMATDIYQTKEKDDIHDQQGK